MKTVVIGGGGYLGRPLARMLREHVDTVSVGRRAGDGVDACLDVRDGEAVHRLLARLQPDVVVMTAYLLGRATDADPKAAVETNVGGVTNVFQAAADVGVRRVVFASSGTVHSGFDHALDESATCNPATLYGRMKLFNEWIAQHYNERFATEIVSYRISGPHGSGKPKERMGTQMPFDTVVSAAAGGADRVELPWSANARFRFIHVEDAAASFLPLVLADTVEHRVYNAPGFIVTIGELAESARSISGLDVVCTEPGLPLNLVWWESTRYEREFAFRPRPMQEWLHEEIIGTAQP